MKFKEVALSDASTEAKVAGLALLLDKELLRLSELVLNTKKLQGPKGDQGLQGPKGEQGDRGFDGTNGKDGVDGAQGPRGDDGRDGVGVQDAHIDFDGSLVITLTDGREINAGDVVPMDVAEKIKVIGNGGGTSQGVLDAIDAINAVIATYGTMALQDDTAVDINGGAIDGTTIGAAVPASGVFTTLSTGTLTATGQTSLGGAAGSEGLRVNSVASSNTYLNIRGRAGDAAPEILANGSGTNISLNLETKGTGSFSFWTNVASDFSGGNRQLLVSHTASAVNYVQVTGAATGGAPIISVQGSDANAELSYRTKGSYNHRFENGSGAINFIVDQTAGSSVVNRNITAGSITGLATRFYAAGSDTNISQVFQSKGTGAIDLAAGSRGVNISNGGTVTAITNSSTGFSYTTQPTATISAPTTAGGVQATATVRMGINTASVASGGTGYTVGDVLTVVGGTPVGSAATMTVSAVSGGVITAVNSTNFAAYTALPTSPVSVTGGTGSGAAFNPLWFTAGFTITNAGSGYVEQPTVTFSGGGGSGAAAYATVGSGTIIRSIGVTGGVASMEFYTPASNSNGVPALRIRDVVSDSYVMLQGGAAYTNIVAQGNSGASLGIYSNGGGNLSFGSRGTSQTTQFRVTDTTSAVNYVQVTGAATGGQPLISAQGSDTNISLSLTSKGVGNVNFWTNNSGSRQFAVTHTAGTIVNYATATGNVAGSAPSFGVAGTDTNIDLALTPKGTGLVRFGTLTASADVPITGYITIKDSGGTVRKLAVIA